MRASFPALPVHRQHTRSCPYNLPIPWILWTVVYISATLTKIIETVIVWLFLICYQTSKSTNERDNLSYLETFDWYHPLGTTFLHSYRNTFHAHKCYFFFRPFDCTEPILQRTAWTIAHSILPIDISLTKKSSPLPMLSHMGSIFARKRIHMNVIYCNSELAGRKPTYANTKFSPFYNRFVTNAPQHRCATDSSGLTWIASPSKLQQTFLAMKNVEELRSLF